MNIHKYQCCKFANESDQFPTVKTSENSVNSTASLSTCSNIVCKTVRVSVIGEGQDAQSIDHVVTWSPFYHLLVELTNYWSPNRSLKLGNFSELYTQDASPFGNSRALLSNGPPSSTESLTCIFYCGIINKTVKFPPMGRVNTRSRDTPTYSKQFVATLRSFKLKMYQNRQNSAPDPAGELTTLPRHMHNRPGSRTPPPILPFPSPFDAFGVSRGAGAGPKGVKTAPGNNQ